MLTPEEVDDMQKAGLKSDEEFEQLCQQARQAITLQKERDVAPGELTRLRAQVEEIRKGFALSCLVLAAKDQEIMDDFERRGLKEVILEASEPLDNNKLVSITIAEAWQKLSLLPSPPMEKPDHAQD